MGPEAQLVLSPLITEDVFSSIVMTQIGRIPHSELTGSHIGPRKPRDTLDWLSTLQLSPSFSYFLVSNMELGTQIEMESQNHGQTACWSVRGIKGANAILFN